MRKIISIKHNKLFITLKNNLSRKQQLALVSILLKSNNPNIQKVPILIVNEKDTIKRIYKMINCDKDGNIIEGPCDEQISEYPDGRKYIWKNIQIDQKGIPKEGLCDEQIVEFPDSIKIILKIYFY